MTEGIIGLCLVVYLLIQFFRKKEQILLLLTGVVLGLQLRYAPFYCSTEVTAIVIAATPMLSCFYEGIKRKEKLFLIYALCFLYFVLWHLYELIS